MKIPRAQSSVESARFAFNHFATQFTNQRTNAAGEVVGLHDSRAKICFHRGSSSISCKSDVFLQNTPTHMSIKKEDV